MTRHIPSSFKPFTLFAFVLITLLTLTPFAGAASAPTPSVPDAGRLGGEGRLLVFLATDKPIYKPGETVYARVVALQAETYFPLRDAAAGAELKITGPRKDELAVMPVAITDSTAGFAWTIPQTAAGGRYEATASVGGSPLTVRSFEVRAYTPPRLRSQIEFLREGYGPGDEVSAVVKVTRAEGGVPAGARLTAVALVDGREAARLGGLTLDNDGLGRATFALPPDIERGEGSLAFIIEDGGLVETASKTIPILINNLDLSFYPEGGDLVVGLPSRVYIQALRPDGKPADISGQVVRVDKDGQAVDAAEAVAETATVHEGRGLAEFTPQPKENYALRLTKPSGLDRIYPLPSAKPSGAVIRSEKPAFPFDEPVVISVQATNDSGAAYLTLYHREKQVAWADLKPGDNRVSLTPGEAEGVLMATVWNRDGQPLAERLIFRQPRFAVKIGLTPETVTPGGSPVPGGKMRLKVATTDENGRPVEAVVGLAITDDALLEMVETRDQAPALPVMVLLENEVEELADAGVYFDPENPEAARDIDLLLGVQGWRRFVLTRLDQALTENPEAVRRALAIRAPEPRLIHFRQAMEVPRAMPMAAGGALDWGLDERAVVEEEAIPEAAAPAAIDADIDLEFLDQAEMQAAIVAPRQEKRLAEVRAPDFAIREYAHKARPDRRPNDRRDFTETIYWNAGLRTSPRDGLAMVEFDLPDSVTTFKVRADAFAGNGALGQGTAEIASLEPFYVEPKLPPAVLSGDRPLVPVVMVNSTAEELDGLGLIPKADDLRPGPVKVPAKLEPGARERLLLALEPEKPGQFELILNAAAGPYADTVTRTMEVLPRGFPIVSTASGLVGPDKPFSTRVFIADDAAPGSIKGEIKVYPSPLANMEEALNALLRQPHGCFEQTSSTSYPLVMAQRYFMSHQGVDPEKIKKADGLLKESYDKLVGFESPEKGYEWFGGDPGHEALTAYGLMQFLEMKEVRPVDGAMLDRTRAWLMSRRDGKGGFKRNERALDSFGSAPVPLTNLYILWALLESGEKPDNLNDELAAAKKILADSQDSYLKALGANIFFLAGDRAAARAEALDLRKASSADGSLGGAETSITRSGGESLAIETTSLAIIAWLRCGEDFAGDVEKSAAWLFEQCQAGRFGSTQSTILALKAINAYDAARAKPKAPGSLQLVIDGTPFGSLVAFDQNTKEALALPDFSAKLSPGEHRLELIMTGGGEMPFALETGYYSSRPADSPDSPMTMATKLSSANVTEGEPVELAVSLQVKAADVPLPLAVVGLPAGLTPRYERLKEMKTAGEIDSYEMMGRELVLYWRALKGGATVNLAIPLIAEIPGEYTAPASRVYGYYLDEHKFWAAGESVKISPR